MIDFDGEELQKEFNEVFGHLQIVTFPTTDSQESLKLEDFNINKLTARQLWWLTKFAKHVRGRCRNNSAFNNYMNRNFSPAKFREVPKTYTDRSGQKKDYMGLEIQVNNQTVGDKEESE